MSATDAIATGDASAALGEAYVRPIFFCWLDILGDPLRANSSGKSIAVAPGMSGDPDFDGQLFDGINPTFVDISPVKEKGGGSDTVTARLSGIVGLDDDLLALIGNPANWQGRLARLWWLVRDATGADRGAVTPYYTGYMMALQISGTPDEQIIEMTIESYLAAFSKASNRTYLDQERYDPGDLSARAAIAIANGISGNTLVTNTPVVTGYGNDGPHEYGFGPDGVRRFKTG